MGRTPNVQPQVLGYLQRHVGETLLLQDISKDMNLEASQIQNAVLRLRARVEGIEVVIAGNSWRYRPPATNHGTDHPLFEEIGRSKKGVVVLQDEQGNLFRAVELE